MSWKNLLTAGGLAINLLGVYMLLVKAGAWQDVLEWPRPLRTFGFWVFERKPKRERSSLAGTIWLVLGVVLQILAVFIPE